MKMSNFRVILIDVYIVCLVLYTGVHTRYKTREYICFLTEIDASLVKHYSDEVGV